MYRRRGIAVRVLADVARVLRPGGVLQLMCKNGTGVLTVFDRDYSVERSFHLYDERELLGVLQQQGMTLIAVYLMASHPKFRQERPSFKTRDELPLFWIS